jgi:hypothetical protein
MSTDLSPIGALSILHLDADIRRTQVVFGRIRDRFVGDADVVSAYLRGGTVLLAVMEHTRDLLEGRFETPGGSAILTDGKFFWRLDAADYLEHYRVALPSEFVAWGESLGWEPVVLSEDAFFDADTFVYDFYRASFDEALWPEHENG